MLFCFEKYFMSKGIVIAIDGYSGCGKSTTAKKVAEAIGYSYLDTGAMYRAVTFFFINNLISLDDESAVSKALDEISIEFRFNEKFQRSDVYLNSLRIEKEIRSMEVSRQVSKVASLPVVRERLVYLQTKIGEKGGVVMDGRDIGTTVFPNAELKVFMTADVKARAYRRQKELAKQGEILSIEEIIENLEERDRIDTTREESPLRKADDAHIIDTTELTISNQVQAVVSLYERVIQ